MLDPKDLIKEKLDIVDVIREFLPLKPAGSNWKALCPFHQEKTPSFMVSPDRQSWRCFGCNEGGDVFSFVMKREGMEFPEVLRMFADKLGIQLRRGDTRLQNQKTVLLDILAAAVEWWQGILFAEEGKSARDYMHARGITDDEAQSWNLGLAPEAWDRLSQHLVQRGFKLADIIASGLVIERQRTQGDTRLPFYDRFRDRLLFPIRDARGAVVGAGGRLLSEESKEAKYVNTPETLLYHKGRILFGLDRAKEAMKAEKTAVLVEGYMDVLSSYRAGVTNTVAVSGTALTEEHTKLLHRYAETVALCFDQDRAGEAAAHRSIGLLLREGFTIHVIQLPKDVKDPDECVRNNPALWNDAVKNASPLFEYLLSRARTRNLRDIQEKKRTAKEVLGFLAKVPDPIERGHYMKELATLLSIDESLLFEALPQERRLLSPERVPETQKTDRRAMLSERLLSLLVKYPSHIATVRDALDPEAVAVGPLRDLYGDMKNQYTENAHDDAYEALFDERKELIDRLLLAAEHFFHSFDPKAITQEIQGMTTMLMRESVRSELQRLEEQLQQETRGEEMKNILHRVDELTKRLALLS